MWNIRKTKKGSTKLQACGVRRWNMENREQVIEQLKTGWTPAEEVILKRRSVRMYKKEQVPEFMIRRILEAGRFAPSAGNGQP